MGRTFSVSSFLQKLRFDHTGMYFRVVESEGVDEEGIRWVVYETVKGNRNFSYWGFGHKKIDGVEYFFFKIMDSDGLPYVRRGANRLFLVENIKRDLVHGVESEIDISVTFSGHHTFDVSGYDEVLYFLNWNCLPLALDVGTVYECFQNLAVELNIPLTNIFHLQYIMQTVSKRHMVDYLHINETLLENIYSYFRDYLYDPEDQNVDNLDQNILNHNNVDDIGYSLLPVRNPNDEITGSSLEYSLNSNIYSDPQYMHSEYPSIPSVLPNEFFFDASIDNAGSALTPYERDTLDYERIEKCFLIVGKELNLDYEYCTYLKDDLLAHAFFRGITLNNVVDLKLLLEYESIRIHDDTHRNFMINLKNFLDIQVQPLVLYANPPQFIHHTGDSWYDVGEPSIQNLRLISSGLPLHLLYLTNHEERMFFQLREDNNINSFNMSYFFIIPGVNNRLKGATLKFELLCILSPDLQYVLNQEFWISFE